MLSDKKLEKLRAIQGGQNDLWYITKQNCKFRDLCYIANILELWNNDPSVSYQDYFDQKKQTYPFSEYLPDNTAHRATVNCSYFGLLRQTIGRGAYNPEDLTPVYFYVKRLCNGDFSNTQVYQHIIDNQLEKITISNNNFAIHPIMFSLKILLLIGDATGTYSISLEEFKLFVATAQHYNEYFEVAESILRFRTDNDFKQKCLANRQKVGDTRYNLVVKNHSYFDESSDSVALIKERIPQTRRRVAEFELKQSINVSVNDEQFYNVTADSLIDNEEKNKFFPAMRTKPFLLLAGISGTGKSQIVKEMAFASCPDIDNLRENAASPGNYCLIEVKPNWHDSTELLGYDSAIKKHYVVTKFVKFIVKAMRYPEVPFFVCLDEMNLAPVEQYFAEFLSVLESRKLIDGTIISEPLIDKSFFKNNLVALDLFDLPASEYKSLANVTGVDLNDESLGENADIWHKLQEEGLCLPQNLIVIGTVNMDETTHQFSRKVIDRAMTFEMNEANFESYFEDKVTLNYVDEPLNASLFFARNVSGNKAMEEFNTLDEQFKENVSTVLNGLNATLEDTPFKIAYRVQNELILYFTELLRENADSELATALDDIMMMKVLPRIEGDDELLGNRSGGALHNLMEFATSHNLTNSIDKIEEMLKRLERSHFTSFWP